MEFYNYLFILEEVGDGENQGDREGDRESNGERERENIGLLSIYPCIHWLTPTLAYWDDTPTN